MAEHQSSHALSPQLGTVLSSLNISLEAELNRYRRTRRIDGLVEEDLFAELEDPSFDLDAMERAVEASVAHTATLARPVTPPPVPVNKKISAHLTTTSSALAIPKPALPPETVSAIRPLPQATDLAISEASHPTTDSQAAVLPGDAEKLTPTGYLASSEKLIESLAEVPPMPEPVDTTTKPKRKTVSLLAGATLGFAGLVAGLGASYLMANPLVTQQLASSLKGSDQESAIANGKSFDPPGPDLSANEFIDLEIDNLSSLKMPQTTISPSIGTSGIGTSETALANPATTNALPPIEGQIGTNPVAIAPTASPTTNPATTPAATPTTSPTPTLASRPVSPAPIETQAVVLPAGLTYYVTTPFTTEQNLITIRESVSEAFVRRFSDGDRIQIAAFDNPQAAGTFVEELKSKSIAAQIYGPTTE